MGSKGRYIVLGLSVDDARDRAERLLKITQANKLKVKKMRGSNECYVVRFVTPEVGLVRPPVALSHALCSKCDHELEDHYNQFCSEWQCYCG